MRFPTRCSDIASSTTKEERMTTTTETGAARALAAADVFTESTTFWVMESIRLDLGYGSQVHP
jgi:hypothetical protein